MPCWDGLPYGERGGTTPAGDGEGISPIESVESIGTYSVEILEDKEMTEIPFSFGGSRYV